MRNFNLFGAVALLAASAVSAKDESKASMTCFNDLCWTSWRCWYRKYSEDTTPDNGCGLPDHVYRPGYDGAQRNTLVWGQNYKMNWMSSYETRDEDIVLEWLMLAAPGIEKPIFENKPDMFYDFRDLKPENFVVAYSRNISAGITEWNFQPRVSDFPNQYLNFTPIEVTGYAMERNIFRIYHPKTFNPHNGSTWDLSDSFSVIREAEVRMIEKAASKQHKAGNKKVAIGVGVGVPVAFLVAFVTSWYTSAWFERRSLEKKGLLFVPARLE